MRNVIIHNAEESGYWAEVPSLPGCVSQGETLEETIANIREAIELYIEVLEEDGKPVPEDSDLQLVRDLIRHDQRQRESIRLALIEGEQSRISQRKVKDIIIAAREKLDDG